MKKITPGILGFRSGIDPLKKHITPHGSQQIIFLFHKGPFYGQFTWKERTVVYRLREGTATYFEGIKLNMSVANLALFAYQLLCIKNHDRKHVKSTVGCVRLCHNVYLYLGGLYFQWQGKVICCGYCGMFTNYGEITVLCNDFYKVILKKYPAIKLNCWRVTLSTVHLWFNSYCQINMFTDYCYH